MCNDEKIRLAREAILNDKTIQSLQAKRVEIYSIAIPKVVLKGNEIVETLWLDETNHPVLSKINNLIEHRTKQILNFYETSKEQEDEL